jgi:hypothetical protein
MSIALAPCASSLCSLLRGLSGQINIPETVHLRQKIVEHGDAPVGERVAMKAAGFALAGAGRLRPRGHSPLAQWPFVRDRVGTYLPPPLRHGRARSAGMPNVSCLVDRAKTGVMSDTAPTYRTFAAVGSPAIARQFTATAPLSLAGALGQRGERSIATQLRLDRPSAGAIAGTINRLLTSRVGGGDRAASLQAMQP